MDRSSAAINNPPHEEQEPTVDLPVIPDKGVRLAFQLAAFRSKYPNLPFDAPTTDYIDFIYAYYPPPDFSSAPWNSDSWSTINIVFPLTRDGQPKSGITKICYSTDWAIHRPSLNKDVATFLSTAEPLLQRHPFFQQWQSHLGAQFQTVSPLGRKPLPTEKTTRSRHLSQATSSLSSQQSASVSAPEDIVVPLPETDSMDQPEQPPQFASAASSAESVPAILAKIQTQLSQLSTQLQAQQTHSSTQQARLSTQLDGLSNRVGQLETIDTPNIASTLNNPSLLPPPQLPHASPQPQPDLLPRPNPYMDVAAPNGTVPWKPADIGFFYPDMPHSWGTAEVVDKEEKVYYRTAYAFTNRLRVAAQSRDPKKISQNLDTCFRGEALRWWNNELNKITRAGLILTATIDDWCAALEKRFRLAPSQAASLLENTRYTLQDARNRRSVTSYVSSIVAVARQCGETNEFLQVLRAWRHLDLELRTAIDEPKEGTTIEAFMDTLLLKQSNWFDIASQFNRRNDVRDSYTDGRAYSYNQKQPFYGRGTERGYRNSPRSYPRHDRYPYPFVANRNDDHSNAFPHTNRDSQRFQNATSGRNQSQNHKAQSFQDDNANPRTSYARQGLPPPPQRPMISDKPFNRYDSNPRDRWKQQESPQNPPKRATAYTGFPHDDEQDR
ncbi:hypothetical protein V8E54_000851 [Elaphomyces granulatus]